jgi:signal transduction histidine kinase
MIHSNVNIIKLTGLPRLRPILAILSLCIALGLLAWSLYYYQPAPNFYGPRAVYSLLILSILLALLGRALLLRMLKLETATTDALHYRLRTTWRLLFLFDITAPLYLAAGVLIGPPAAVLLALITQTVLQGFTLWRGFVSWIEACYRITSTALLALISSTVYSWIGGPPQNHFVNNFAPIAESKEFLGSIVAAIVMMLLIIAVSLPIMAQANSSGLKGAWREYLQSPVLRFQLLVLSVGPLLPVVDIFDDLAAELAWFFFLVPLFAIYYLALISTRLSIRTDELQRTLQDLSSARRRQGELRDYATLITRVQEEERRRLARELHDDTAQALIALSLGLDGLGRAIGKLDLPEKDAQWLANLQDLADHTLEGVRRACRDLRPSVLDDLGLRAALEWLSDSSSTRGVPCAFTCAGLPRPTTPEAEIAIFRIVQEALSNIWRHSQATQVSVELKYLPNLLKLTVYDNGKGFSAEQHLDLSHNSKGGLGLVGMRERAMLIGAVLTISSSPGEGCKVEISLPLPE